MTPQDDAWTQRWRSSLLQQGGESERDWAMRLVGRIEEQHQYTLYWVGETMRLGRIIAKLQRAVSKARLRVQREGAAP